MSQPQQVTARGLPTSGAAIVVLVAIFVAGLFLMGFDQGETLSLVYGQNAYAEAFLHELSHDVRHAMGFPCH